MKTIRNQIKYRICLQIPVFLKKGNKNCWYPFLLRLIREQQTKNRLNLARKRFLSRRAILWPSKCVLLHHFQKPITYYVTSF